MDKKLFVNIAVSDLSRAKAFYEAIGARINPQFSDETAACMVFSETIYVMLLTHEKWAFFTKKPISDSHISSEVMLALSCEGRNKVDILAEDAAKAGGKAGVIPTQDHGFMYSRSFEDPDGHIWEVFWMDSSVPK